MAGFNVQNNSEKSLKRWNECPPDKELTWGFHLTGDAFVDLANKYNCFSDEKSILELGPGYGRILNSLIHKKIPFKDYTGIDASDKNIDFLKQNFKLKNVEFLKGIFSEIILKKKYDVVISSLVLKHTYPTFFESINNIRNYVNIEGKFFFDLIENQGLTKIMSRYLISRIIKDPFRKTPINTENLIKNGPKYFIWEKSGTYIAYYSKDDIRRILSKIPLSNIQFDNVIHHKKKGKRLVVIASN